MKCPYCGSEAVKPTQGDKARRLRYHCEGCARDFGRILPEILETHLEWSLQVSRPSGDRLVIAIEVDRLREKAVAHVSATGPWLSTRVGQWTCDLSYDRWRYFYQKLIHQYFYLDWDRVYGHNLVSGTVDWATRFRVVTPHHGLYKWREIAANAGFEVWPIHWNAARLALVRLISAGVDFSSKPLARDALMKMTAAKVKVR